MVVPENSTAWIEYEDKLEPHDHPAGDDSKHYKFAYSFAHLQEDDRSGYVEFSGQLNESSPRTVSRPLNAKIASSGITVPGPSKERSKTIPTLNYSLTVNPESKAQFISQLRSVIINVGFLYLSNTPVDIALISTLKDDYIPRVRSPARG
ncbi:hypothetical protein EV361DRAFT_1007335 [Lentinula raphanica]|nr:hypothetical protein EV361DRAFT_1007335 [Lentinula raphanica]